MSQKWRIIGISDTNLHGEQGKPLSSATISIMGRSLSLPRLGTRNVVKLSAGLKCLSSIQVDTESCKLECKSALPHEIAEIHASSRDLWRNGRFTWQSTWVLVSLF